MKMDHFENKRVSSKNRPKRQLILKYKQQLKGLEIKAKDRAACFSIVFVNVKNLSRLLML
jgi:hypothetical protein